MAHLSRIGRQGPQPTNLPRSGDRMRHWRNETAGIPMDSGRSREMILVVEDNPDVKTVATTFAGATQLPHDSSRKRESCARFPCRRETRRPGVLRRDAAGRPRWPGTGAHYRQAISTHSGIAHERLRESTQRPARDADLTKALSDFRPRRSSAFNAQRRTGAIVARHIVGFRRWRAEW